jgi:3-phenylpropionate/trans-cinnamate dioxygenase ferredoxin reductase subunit
VNGASKILVVGASVATGAFVSQLRSEGFTGQVTVVDQDPDAPYDRPPLSKEFLGQTSHCPQAPWWEDSCELILGRAVSLDVASSSLEVTCANGAGQTLGADHLVVAAGAAPVRLPGQPAGVLHLRTAGDARALRSVARPGSRVLILGAGTIGTELASSLTALGCMVEVIDQADRPLQRFFGGHLGEQATHWIQEGGVSLHLGLRVENIAAEEDRWSVRTDATELFGDLVISAVGTRPVTGWLAGSGLDIRDGVRCDCDGNALDASGNPIGNVHSIGDVSAWSAPGGPSRRHEDWTNAQWQGRHLARRLMGNDEVDTVGQPYFWTSQFGRSIRVVGRPQPDATLVQHSEDPARKAAFYTLENNGETTSWIAVNSMKEFTRAMRESAHLVG